MSDTPDKTSAPPTALRTLTQNGGPRIERVGIGRPRLDDVYHFFLRSPWRVVLAAIFSAYLVANLVFGVLYWIVGGIENASGGFGDAFFFSVQTMATIGYGKLAPVSTASHLLVTVEAIVSILGTATTTGLIFAKFSRPTAKVMFSRRAVVTDFEGQKSLLFRVANTRTSQIVEANVRVVVLRSEVTREGRPVRRMHELKLMRSSSAMFALSWTVIHPIDDHSPFWQATPASLAAAGVEFIAAITGLDETLAQTVHARAAYHHEDILWDHEFEDVILMLPGNRRVIDFSKFDDVKPVAPAAEKAASFS